MSPVYIPGSVAGNAYAEIFTVSVDFLSIVTSVFSSFIRSHTNPSTLNFEITFLS